MGISLTKSLDFGKVSRKLRNAGQKGLKTGLAILAEESEKQVPKDTGTLAASLGITVTPELSGIISYNTAYARVQHERTDYRHPGGGKAKYLSDPAEDEGILRRMEETLGDALRKELS